MVESNILALNKTDHVLTGDRNAENILIDANVGDDTLVGSNKDDYTKRRKEFRCNSSKEAKDFYHILLKITRGLRTVMKAVVKSLLKLH